MNLVPGRDELSVVINLIHFNFVISVSVFRDESVESSFAQARALSLENRTL
jgi:hypothetical protein